MKLALLVLMLAACSKTAKVTDDCRTVVDKSRTVMAELAKASHKPAVTTGDEDKLVERCHDALASGKREATMDCILAAKDDDGIRTCLTAGFKGHSDAGKLSEAKLQLHKIGKNAKTAFAEKAAFPIGKAGPTPAIPCCEQPNHQCAPTAADWAIPGWQALEMTIDEPFRFQYSYESDGKTFTATATGDMACDGHPTTLTAHGAVENGDARITDTME